MPKTKTKAFSNLIISIILLAFEAWAYIQANGFRQVKGAYVQASTFPQIMIIGMGIFTVVLLASSPEMLPKECKILLDTDGGNLLSTDGSNVKVDYEYPHNELLKRFARKIAPIDDGYLSEIRGNKTFLGEA